MFDVVKSPVSALDGAAFQGFAEITEMGLCGMITLRGDLGSAGIKAAVKAATGSPVPKQRRIAQGASGAVAWMSPDELLIMVDYDAVIDALAAIETTLAGHHYLAENVSDARAVFQISGVGAREVIAKLAPVDMAAFSDDEIRRTRLAQVAAAFWMVGDDTLQIVCFRSVAQYVFDLLSTAAQSGTEVGYIE